MILSSLVSFSLYFEVLLGGCMAIEVGSVLNGTVSGITKFGAFIDLGDKQTGLVHISEVAHGYVEDINDVLKVQDAVKVKVLSVDGSKIGLSIRQTQEKPQVEERRPERRVQSRQSAESCVIATSDYMI